MVVLQEYKINISTIFIVVDVRMVLVCLKIIFVVVLLEGHEIQIEKFRIIPEVANQLR